MRTLGLITSFLQYQIRFLAVWYLRIKCTISNCIADLAISSFVSQSWLFVNNCQISCTSERNWIFVLVSVKWNITYHYVNLSKKVLSLVSYCALKSVGLRHSALNESITMTCVRVRGRRAARRGAAAQLIDWLIRELKCDAAAVAIVTHTHTLLGNCSWCLPFRWPAAVQLNSYCVKLAASICLWLLESTRARSNTVKPSWSMFYSLCDSVRTSLSVVVEIFSRVMR